LEAEGDAALQLALPADRGQRPEWFSAAKFRVGAQVPATEVSMADQEALRVVEVSLDEAVEASFDDSSRSDGPVPAPPRFVLVCGTPASGKTRLRHAKYASGYVSVDAGDIFRRLPDSEEMDFPGEHEWFIDMVGELVARRAIEERRHIVTEVFEANPQKLIGLIDSMKALGYHTELVGVRTDLERSIEWNQSRGPANVSSYYTDRFNVRWLSEAARAQLAPDEES